MLKPWLWRKSNWDNTRESEGQGKMPNRRFIKMLRKSLSSVPFHTTLKLVYSCFPHARYSHDPDTLCDWQATSFPVLMEPFSRLSLTGISVKHPLLITETNSEEWGFKQVLTLALSYKFLTLNNIDGKSPKCFPLVWAATGQHHHFSYVGAKSLCAIY